MKSDLDIIIDYLNDMINISINERDISKTDHEFNFYEGNVNAYQDTLNVVNLMKAVKGE